MSPEDRSDQAYPPAPNFLAFAVHHRRLFGFMMARTSSSRWFHALSDCSTTAKAKSLAESVLQRPMMHRAKALRSSGLPNNPLNVPREMTAVSRGSN
jgi:hypothetical protein